MKINYKKMLTVFILCFAMFGKLKAQPDLSIGNISAGYSYNSSTGVISDIYFTVLSNENEGVSEYGVGVYFCIPSATSLNDCYLLKALVDGNGISGNAAKDVEIDVINVNQVNPLPPNGSYRLLVYVDHEMEVDETDENNNGVFISTQGNNLNFTASGSTSIDNSRNQLGISNIYPIPANGYVYFEIPGNSISEEYTVQIFSVEGREIIKEKLTFSNANYFSLNISSLDPGIYTYIVSSNEKRSLGKLVKN